MRNWYTGSPARHYNCLWHTFTERSLAAVLGSIDFPALQSASVQRGPPPSALDVGCGTGILLRSLLQRVPGLQASGIDASADMLAQARLALSEWPHVALAQAKLGPGETADLPYPPGTFDLITCTNVFHYLPQPEATLAGLRRLLAPAGQLILEDFARRAVPFPWPLFEWVIRYLDVQHVRTYTQSEAHALCIRAGLRISQEQRFKITRLWHGWLISAW